MLRKLAAVQKKLRLNEVEDLRSSKRTSPFPLRSDESLELLPNSWMDSKLRI